MIKKGAISIVVAIAVLSAGCATGVALKVEPEVMRANNDYFEVTAVPKCGYHACRSFLLTIKNKTNKNLEVNWNKTLYIARGQTSGGFMFEGIVYRDRNNQKSPDIIFENGVFVKLIWSNNLVEYSGGKFGGWRNEDMPLGENGIYLTVDVDGKEITQKLVTNISVSPGKK